MKEMEVNKIIHPVVRVNKQQSQVDNVVNIVHPQYLLNILREEVRIKKHHYLVRQGKNWSGNHDHLTIMVSRN